MAYPTPWLFQFPLANGAGKTKQDAGGPRRGLSEAIAVTSPSKPPSAWTWGPSAGHWRIYRDAYLGAHPAGKEPLCLELNLWSRILRVSSVTAEPTKLLQRNLFLGHSMFCFMHISLLFYHMSIMFTDALILL